jgi:tetratricopeptide (TPR) repeat protein
MPTPSHRPASFKANRVFTDRDEARELFAQQCAAPQQQDEYRVLNFYGVGGQGKSALCGQFEKHLDSLPNNENHQLAWAKINFEDSNKRNPIAALMALRLQLAANGKLWFPAFDTAFARYFAITQAGRNLETSYPELFQQSHDLLQGLATVAESVTGLALLGNMIERLQKFDEKRILRQWMERRGAELLTGLENFAPHELESKLVEFLGADVDDWLHNEINAPQRRVVLLYDTYEALWRDQPSKTDLLVDKWVRKLVSESPAVLHVILGREALAWTQQDPEEWQGIITPCPLDHLTDTDADSFLQTVPVVENDIRARIVAGAKGIPFYLNLQVDQYESCKRRNLTPQADEYGGKEPEMLARFISHLPDTTRRALRVASYPRWLDETLFLNLCEKFLGGAALISLHELTAYSFWTKQADRYFLHAVMRDYLQAESLECEKTLYRNIQQHLFDYYDGKLQALTSARELTEKHNEAINEGAYHLETLNCPKIPYWVDKYREKFDLAAQWITLEPLLTLALQILEEIGDKKGEANTLGNISGIYRTRGAYDTAIDHLTKALSIWQEIGDKKGEANTLGNISGIYRTRGAYDTALDHLTKALSIQREIDDKKGEAITLNNISDIYRTYGAYDTALDHLTKALSIQQEIGDKKGEATTLNNISQIFRRRKEHDKSLDYLQKSLAIQQEIGNKKSEGTILNNISRIYDTRGDYNTAIEYLLKSLAIQQEIGDKKGEGTILNNISQIYSAHGDYDIYHRQMKTRFLKIH